MPTELIANTHTSHRVERQKNEEVKWIVNQTGTACSCLKLHIGRNYQVSKMSHTHQTTNCLAPDHVLQLSAVFFRRIQCCTKLDFVHGIFTLRLNSGSARTNEQRFDWFEAKCMDASEVCHVNPIAWNAHKKPCPFHSVHLKS